jgi:hypothetical protein
MNAKFKEQITSIVGTYVRAFVAGMATAYALGATDPKDYGKAGLAAILPILMRWANPKDAFPKKG